MLGTITEEILYPYKESASDPINDITCKKVESTVLYQMFCKNQTVTHHIVPYHLNTEQSHELWKLVG